jgi:antirepressor protein
MSEIVRIPFRGDEILAANHQGKPHVILKPALEAIGLDFDSQRQKLAGKSWATTVLITALAEDGRTRQMLAADVRTFLMLLATIDERRVAKNVRPKLVAYQSEVADAIERYWTKGQAINPRAIAGSVYEPHTYTWDEVCALVEQRFGLSMTVNELTRMLRTGGVLKQTGAPTKRYRHLFWFTGSAWNIHPHVLPQIVVKVYDTGRELQDFRFIQARLELDGFGTAIGAHHAA